MDSTDRDRLSITKDELHKMMGHEELSKANILVFANKQDVKGCLSAAEISKLLNLQSIRNHGWHIQACCALTGEGYEFWKKIREIDFFLSYVYIFFLGCTKVWNGSWTISKSDDVRLPIHENIIGRMPIIGRLSVLDYRYHIPYLFQMKNDIDWFDEISMKIKNL